jgi:hypothetical protein
LQPLARTGDSKPSPEILDAVHTWAREADGTVARTTAYHAGQLFALVHLTPSDTPLESFALFYAVLALVAFIRELVPPPRSQSSSSSSSSNRDGNGDMPIRFALDKLVDRADPELTNWIHGGDQTPSLEAVGDLGGVGAGNRILRLAGKALIGLKVWKVGELLGKTLVQLASEEERRDAGGMRVKVETR